MLNAALELRKDLEFLRHLILIQGKRYVGKKGHTASILDLEWPPLEAVSPYGALVHSLTDGASETLSRSIRMVLVLALAPHVQPQLLDVLGMPDANGRAFTEYGRFRNDFNAAFLPTVQTALFLLAGKDLALRFQLHPLFLVGSPLIDSGILQLDTHPSGSGFLNSKLGISPRWVQKLTTGKDYVPDFGAGFPAQASETKLDWEDLVLHPHTAGQVNDLKHWLKYRGRIFDDKVLSKRIKPGYRALFHGPPGTGKTLTVNLLGKSAGLPVFRVDLSLVVSKYVGETEKNLSRLFQEAAGQDWVLFFDEADSLFGRRTNAQSAHDKYANQEVSYLLQKVEDHPGLVILATNFKSNIDDAFLRRFNSVIHFPQPGKRERMLLWQAVEPEILPYAQDVMLEDLARQFELSGAHIVNIVHSASLIAWAEGTSELHSHFLEQAIQKEYEKEGRVLKR